MIVKFSKYSSSHWLDVVSSPSSTFSSGITWMYERYRQIPSVYLLHRNIVWYDQTSQQDSEVQRPHSTEFLPSARTHPTRHFSQFDVSESTHDAVRFSPNFRTKSELTIRRLEKCLCFTLASLNYYEDLLHKYSILLAYFPLATADPTHVVHLGF